MRLCNQEMCPISMERFIDNVAEPVFDHHGVRFNAMSLHEYLIAAPNAGNPVNRIPFSTAEIKSLNRLFPTRAKVLSGLMAEEAKRENDNRCRNISFLDEEARECIDRLSRAWWTLDVVYFYNALDTATAGLKEIRNDIISLEDGKNSWDLIKKSLMSMAESRMPPSGMMAELENILEDLEIDDVGLDDLDPDYIDDVMIDSDGDVIMQHSPTFTLRSTARA